MSPTEIALLALAIPTVLLALAFLADWPLKRPYDRDEDKIDHLPLT